LLGICAQLFVTTPEIVGGWSAGTGVAGVLGSGAYLALTGTRPRYVFLGCLPLVAVYALVFGLLLRRPRGPRGGSPGTPLLASASSSSTDTCANSGPNAGQADQLLVAADSAGGRAASGGGEGLFASPGRKRPQGVADAGSPVPPASPEWFANNTGSINHHHGGDDDDDDDDDGGGGGGGGGDDDDVNGGGSGGGGGRPAGNGAVGHGKDMGGRGGGAQDGELGGGRMLGQAGSPGLRAALSDIWRVGRQCLFLAVNMGLVYYLEYLISQGAANNAQRPADRDDPRASWWMRNAYEVLQVCYQTGVLLSRSSLGLVTIKRVGLLTIAQACNLALWLAQDTWHFLPLGVQFAHMVFVGLMGGLSYVSIFYLILNGTAFAPRDKETAVNVAAMFMNVGIVLAGVTTVVLDATVFKSDAK
jgi:hypothetical protein